MSIYAKYLRVEMPDGSLWDIPVDVIARSHAEHYAHEYGGDIERSLAEGTGPLFESDDYAIEDWAANSMDWADVESVAREAERPGPPVDFQEGWVNGVKAIVWKPKEGAA